MTLDHTDIEDNYADYVQDTWGYAWDAWDVLPADVIRRHDHLLKTDTAVDTIDLASLTNFERWALVSHDEKSVRLESLRLIISSSEDSPGLNLAEVFDFAVRAFSDEELFDEALHVEEKLVEKWPEYPGLALARLYRELREGQPTEPAVARVLENVEDTEEMKVDLWIEVAEELLALGLVSHARDVLERGRSVAIERDDRPSLLDIDLILEEAPQVSDTSRGPTEEHKTS